MKGDNTMSSIAPVGTTKQTEQTDSKPKTEEKKDGYYSFRFRSTGLGETILMGEPLDVLVQDDLLIMKVQSTEPVRWVIRAGLSYRGLLKAIMLGLKFSVIKFVLFGWTKLKNPKLPTEF